MARKYEQTRRAEQQEATRRRIVEAAIELHGTEGPDHTTMSAIAERAGVQRNTLYRHFPDERAVFDACSAHYSLAHPMPDAAAWREIGDPGERLRHGLGELFDYWAETEPMIANVLRDAEVNPIVSEVFTRHGLQPLLEMHAALLEAWPKKRRTADLEAALDLAMSFRTWQTLVRGRGLTSAAAADLMARMVASA